MPCSVVVEGLGLLLDEPELSPPGVAVGLAVPEVAETTEGELPILLAPALVVVVPVVV